VRVTYPAHLIFLDFTPFGKAHKMWRFSLCNLRQTHIN
jgi:hypothetical protein